jgi:diguanylate cyclase (GGDEF)-like protein
LNVRNWAWQAVLALTAAGLTLSMTGAAPPWTAAAGALIATLLSATVILARRPDGGGLTAGDAARSPWLRLAAGVGIAPLASLAALHQGRAAVPISPSVAVLSLLSDLLLISGLFGLLRKRAPGQALDLLLGAALCPVAGGFVVWIALLQLPSIARLGPSALGSAVAALVIDISLLATSIVLLRFDDEQRPALALSAIVLGLLTVEHALWIGGARFASAVGPSWPMAAVVAAGGVWLAAGVHPALAAEVPHQPSPAAGISVARRLLVMAMVLTGGPALVVEYAHIGSIRQPLWVAGGSATVTMLVIVYLLRLVHRAGHLEHLAQHDELTGLANRYLYLDRLSLALDRARRNSESVAVLFVDLDRFKQINDSLGHSGGDRVLQLAARRLTKVVGDRGLVARVGGDEFTLFVPDRSFERGVATLCDAVLSAFERPFALGRDEVFVTASVGVARYPEAGLNPETLVNNADAAMYKAKRRGRDTFVVYSPEIDSRSRDRLSLESGLHIAIERDHLELHYQPKVDLHDNSIVGVEALVRWNHPQRGLLGPDAFIPLAEESGLIVRLDEWVLERAATQAKQWLGDGFSAFTMAVNLSDRDFQEGKVADMVASVLRRTGLDPTKLEFELTETLAKDDPESTRATLLDLKDMGVHLSIDDFGTGYSALGLLATMPFDRLKIDKSFVERIIDDYQYALVTGVIALAQGLKLQVTAEGVETVSQLEFLRAHGCDVMQGYLFSKPLPSKELETVLMFEQVAGVDRLTLAAQHGPVDDWRDKQLYIPARRVG